MAIVVVGRLESPASDRPARTELPAHESPPRRARGLWFLIAATLWMVLFGSEVAAQNVTNDNFANPLTLTGTSGSATRFQNFGFTGGTLNNFGTSKEASEPDHAGNIGGRSVWFTWTPPISGAASFQATPSSFFVTNLIGIYTGFFVNSNFLTVVTNNSLGGGSFTNTVRSKDATTIGFSGSKEVDLVWEWSEVA